MSRISRAQKPWLRHVSWMAWKYGEAAKSRPPNAIGSGDGKWHEKIISSIFWMVLDDIYFIIVIIHVMPLWLQ